MDKTGQGRFSMSKQWMEIIQILKIGCALLVCGMVVLVVLSASERSVSAPARPPTVDPAAMQKKYGPDYITHPRLAGAELDRLTRKCGGDITRLTPKEQNWVDSVTAGHGGLMLMKRAADLHL